MAIVISDERIIKRLNQLADQLNQTPEQIIVDAIEQFSSVSQEPVPQENKKAFRNAIRGIGDSGDPELAHRVKDILRKEIDPIEGWRKPRGTEDTD